MSNEREEGSLRAMRGKTGEMLTVLEIVQMVCFGWRKD